MARRRSSPSTPRPYPGSVLLGQGAPSRRRGRRRPPWRGLLVLLLLAGVVVAGVLVVPGLLDRSDHGRHAAAERFVAAWARGDRPAMWAAVDAKTRDRRTQPAFTAAYASADRAASVERVRPGRVGPLTDGRVRVPVTVTTKDFGTLRGTVVLPVAGRDEGAGVVWSPELRLPGLRRGEAVRRRSATPPRRARILAGDGSELDATSLGASIAGRAGDKPTGLQRIYDDRLGGRPATRLLFGTRTIRTVRAVRGRTVRTAVRPNLQARAAAALGDRLGGVAVVRPSDGSVLALAGLAVSAPQPPGSTFKIITLAAALQHRVATPSSTYPVRTSATLSGTKLRNASDESCGGSLTASFAISCNSVFAPLGAKVGAKRLVAMARAFGFEERPPVPAIVPSTTRPAAELRDALAVGATAIGQDRDLATPLEMATVAATIGEGGVRARPRVAQHVPVVRRRVVRAKVAGQVRTMMLAVVRGGTGTAAAIPGVEVAGKTGTAELRPTAGGPPDPKNTDAWFVAFAPARNPKVAVAVMLVGAGAGGAAAAPIARQVLQAAL